MSDEADNAIQALWDRTNAAVEAGTFDRRAFVAHLREEHRLTKDDPASGNALEAIVQLGIDLGFIEHPDVEVALLLEGKIDADDLAAFASA